MTILHPTTQRRLQKIPLVPSVWEGDRRPLGGFGSQLNLEEQQGECILWVDGSEGIVRAMDVVSSEMGPEAIVRTLIRAMENPHNPAQPARPQKIVVRDRQIQFFLRGALQNLDITVDYVPDLPLIDELFRGFEEMEHSRVPLLPSQYEKLLKETAAEIWEAAPWEAMADYDIIAIELNQWDVETIYACVMGMLGQEYGIILYRSLDSLKRFRSSILEEDSMDHLEKAFLSQDCWFLNYESLNPSALEDEDFDLGDLPFSEIRPLFGSVHPYEGMRPRLDEEEARAVYVILQSFIRFFKSNEDQLLEDPIPKLSKTYRIPLTTSNAEKISLRVSSLPELSQELMEMLEEFESDDDDDDEFDENLAIRDDLVPKESFLSLGMMPWDLKERVANNAKTFYQSQNITSKGEGLPVILIQTSRPKAKTMLETIESLGGIDGICFNPGHDPFSELDYDLGILRTGDGTLFIISEFMKHDSTHVQARKKWDQRCKQTKGYCGLIIAMGLKGASRGNPKLQDMIAIFETKFIDAKELDLGVLQLMPHFD